MTNNETILIPNEINEVTHDLANELKRKLSTLTNQDNALTIANYLIYMKNEVNLSENYRISLIRALVKLSKYNKPNKNFNDITRDDFLAFLNSTRKPEPIDPLHKWIGTYNHYLVILSRFFKWLHYPDINASERPKPSVIENLKQLKRKEKSIYKPTDLWTQEDDLLFLKYCPSKRDKCYHMISRDTSARPHEILRLRIKDVVFKMAENMRYAEVLLNGKTGSRPVPLINSMPYVKDYLNDHPQASNPNAYLIFGRGKSYGKKMSKGFINYIYRSYKTKFFPKLLDDPKISPEDKVKIKELLKKPWNPYIRRHSALTEKSQILKEHVLRLHAGWSPNSNMHSKYIHYFGNESNQSLLEAYGIKTKQNPIDRMKPKQCPHCSESSIKTDAKFCPTCNMVLSYDAYTETIQDNNKVKDEISQLKYEHEKQMEGMNEHIDRLESTISNVFSKISGGLTQLTGIESIDKKRMKQYARDPDKIK